MVSISSKFTAKQKNNLQVQQSFWDTSLNLNNGIYNFKVNRKTTKQHTSPTKFFGYKFKS